MRRAPAAFSDRQWLSLVVLTACTVLAVLALTAGRGPHPGEQRLEVTDDGEQAGGEAGGDGQPASPGPGHGIVGMRERIGAFGGWLVAGPLPERGFHVLAEVPVEGAA